MFETITVSGRAAFEQAREDLVLHVLPLEDRLEDEIRARHRRGEIRVSLNRRAALRRFGGTSRPPMAATRSIRRSFACAVIWASGP